MWLPVNFRHNQMMHQCYNVIFKQALMLHWYCAAPIQPACSSYCFLSSAHRQERPSGDWSGPASSRQVTGPETAWHGELRQASKSVLQNHHDFSKRHRWIECYYSRVPTTSECTADWSAAALRESTYWAKIDSSGTRSLPGCCINQLVYEACHSSWRPRLQQFFMVCSFSPQFTIHK